MTYHQAVAAINNRQKFGIKPGLERITKLLSLLGNPQDQCEFIHIAGTNGKGSVAVMLQNILTASGKKTGLFTSPYVRSFTERFQIDGAEIDQGELATLTQEILPFADQIPELTEFELITAIAFLWFTRRGCDVTVLETGLGGRLDSTNVIKPPLAAVITPVSMDHMDVLGNTLEQIAREKCGIIKRGGLVICSAGQPFQVQAVIAQTAAQTNSRLITLSENEITDVSLQLDKTSLTITGLPVSVPLAGRFQITNIQTAVSTALALGIPPDAITKGLRQARHPARFELLHTNPVVILDGAHNQGGALALKETLAALAPGKKITAIMGMLKDKDTETITSILCPLFDQVFCTQPNHPRALAKEALHALCVRYCKSEALNQQQALKSAFAQTQKDGLLLVCGSLYLCADLRVPLTKSAQPRQK